jgi:hypothetical protein
VAREENDLFELGRRAAVMLNYAATTKTPIDRRQWEQCALKIKRNPIIRAAPPARLSHLPGDKIEAILKLVRKREVIETRLRIVEMRIREIEIGTKVRKVEAKRETPAQPRKRGRTLAPMKDEVLALLKSAGPEGLKAREIAERIGRKTSNVAVWLYNSGLRIPGVSKPRRGWFAYREPVEPEYASPQTPSESDNAPILPDEEVKADAATIAPAEAVGDELKITEATTA